MAPRLGRTRNHRPFTRRWFIVWGAGFLTAASLVAAALVAVSGVVYSRLPQAAKLDEGFEKVDAIVCLTGGRGRIRRALEIFDKGYGESLFISGVEPGVKMRQILREINWVGPVDESRITLGDRSGNTIENALEVKQYLDQRGLKSVLVVTSGYHARRAHYIFEHVLADRQYRIQITWYEQEPFDEADWWKSATGIWVTVGEYLKFLLSYGRLQFLPG